MVIRYVTVLSNLISILCRDALFNLQPRLLLSAQVTSTKASLQSIFMDLLITLISGFKRHTVTIRF
jgi:hypothetical protein